MATTTTELMTAEEFLDWANRHENAGKQYELVNGEVVEMPSPGEAHAFVCWLVIRVLTNYLTKRGSGHMLTNDGGLIVRRNPDTVRGPDAMVFLDDLTLTNARLGHCERIPSLVVEVRSPSDRDGKIIRRVEQYHRRGIPLVWVIDFEDLLVTAYRPNEFPKVLDETESLTGNGVLPDFSCKVAELFALPGTVNQPNS
jgi:Uma2 family endonuclease